MNLFQASRKRHSGPGGIACQQCQRAGGDLRLVNYPALIVLVVFAFPVEFGGRWCRLHRVMRLLIAAFITAVTGWFGFPFSIFTLWGLLKLGRGEGLHRANNARELHNLAEVKEEHGDLRGAVFCLEASLQFVDDIWTREELHRLYALLDEHDDRRAQNSTPASAGRVLAFLAGALALGGLAGVADYFWNTWLTSISLPFMDGLFGWLPLAGLGVPAIFLLKEWLAYLVEREDSPSVLFTVALGVVGLAALLYGLLAGRALGNLMQIFASLQTLPSLSAAGQALLATLARGWLLELARVGQWVRQYDGAGIFHLGALVMLAAFGMYATGYGIRWLARWQMLVADARAEIGEWRKAPSVGQWAALVLGVALLFAPAVLVRQQGQVDYLQARDAFHAGLELEYYEKYEQAIVSFEEAARLDPGYAEAYEEIAWCAYQTGDSDRAVKEFQKSIEIDPERPSAHYYLGRVYYFQEKNDAAMAEFERAIVLEPRHYAAHIGAGWTAYSLGDPVKAEVHFTQALELEARPYDAYIGLGTLYEDRGQTERAIASYEQANLTDVTSAEADVYLGLAYYRRNQLDKAAQHLEFALIKEPGDRLARNFLLMSYLQMGRFEDAIRLGDDTVRRYPEWAGAQALLGSALWETGQVEAFEAALKTARELPEKTVTDRSLIIQALNFAGKFAEAEVEARLALEAEPGEPRFWLDLSNAQLSQGRVSAALESCQRAEQNGAGRVEVLLKRADIMLETGDLAQSLALLQEAARQAPEQAPVQSMISRVYYEQGDFLAAERSAQKAVELDAYYVSGYIDLAAARLETGDINGALQAASKAVSLSPQDDVPHFLLAMCYLEAGQKSQGYIELKRFMALYHDTPGSSKMRAEAEKMLESLQQVY